MSPHPLATMRIDVTEARDRWATDTTQALELLAETADYLGRALGTVSRDEAIDALKLQAAELLEALR